MPKLVALDDLFVKELRDILDAEKQIAKALPKMARATGSDSLQEAFEEHLSQTEGQIERLEQVFGLLETRPKGTRCEAMKGIIGEGSELLKGNGIEIEESVRDAGLIASAQKVEHYEIAAYGTLVTYANRLGYTEAARLLKETLAEEKATDQKLTKLAERGPNPRAAAQATRRPRERAIANR